VVGTDQPQRRVFDKIIQNLTLACFFNAGDLTGEGQAHYNTSRQAAAAGAALSALSSLCPRALSSRSGARCY
jgi:hypothetical protein